MKRKIHKLTVPMPHPSVLLGISSHENDYRLSWALNGMLELNFRKTDNLKVKSVKDTESLEFSVFQTDDEDRLLKMNLISNRCPDGFLLGELKNIDFILQIFGDVSETEINEIIVKLKSIEFVSMVFKVDADRLKAKSNLPVE